MAVISPETLHNILPKKAVPTGRLSNKFTFPSVLTLYSTKLNSNILRMKKANDSIPNFPFEDFVEV